MLYASRGSGLLGGTDRSRSRLCGGVSGPHSHYITIVACAAALVAQAVACACYLDCEDEDPGGGGGGVEGGDDDDCESGHYSSTGLCCTEWYHIKIGKNLVKVCVVITG